MSTNKHDPLAWIDDELAGLERAGLRRRLAERDGAQTATVTLDGRELVNFGSNDYLGLAADPRLAAAARAAIEREGWGSGASPLVSGRADEPRRTRTAAGRVRRHRGGARLPLRLRRQRGRHSRAGGRARTPIFADAKNHASLIDGCRLSRATRFVYPALRLRRARSDAPRQPATSAAG